MFPSLLSQRKKWKTKSSIGYPKDLQFETTIEVQDDGEVKLTIARNDPLISSYNPFQLSAWKDAILCLAAML